MNGYDAGSRRNAWGRSYGQRDQAGPRGPRRPGRGSGSRDGFGRRPPRHAECPPDLREPFKAGRDFLAGLIQVFGLPARLSFGGVAPARDGRQIVIDIRSVQQGGRGYDRDDRDDELGLLIGKHGATLDALSAVTNAAMHRGDRRDLFFAVDIDGYRARRAATLRSIALRCSDRVAREGISIELDPMPPSERRIVHVTLAASREVMTESTGQGSSRRVVIMPRENARRAGPRDQPEDEEEFLD